MKIKGVSFSYYKTKIDTYRLEKLSLFEFLFTQILLNDALSKEIKLVECLKALDIKEDLFYLLNNVYYKFIDNKIIISEEKEFYNLTLEDIVLNNRFTSYLKQGYVPILNGSEEKDFIYDHLENKVVLSKEEYDDSNVCVISVDSSIDKIEEVVNSNIKGLLNLEKGIATVSEVIVDPYYFLVELKEVSDKYLLNHTHKQEIYRSLISNSLYLGNELLKGEYLSNNIYFSVLFSNMEMKDYCEYLFVYNKEKEGNVEDNIIYVDYNFSDCHFIDLVKQESYITGFVLLENGEKISTFSKVKNKNVSEFKLYLVKNKAKFKIDIEKVIKLF